MPDDVDRNLPQLDMRAAARVIDALRSDDHGGVGEAVGPEIAGYRLDRVLGEGAGGTVYRARRDGSEHPVALKVFHQRLGASPAAQRAWRELDILATLRLPAVPRLLDHGTADGHLFIVTELIDGCELTEHCAARALDRRGRVELLARIADAIQSLHERGVIHRDLKPSNILVDAHGQPTLIDLGIASGIGGGRADGSASLVTAEGTPVGTPAFMSPEQARGNLAALSTRSDVHALGAIAYLLLTGQTPHETGAFHETIRRVAEEPPRDPRNLDPSLPKPLAAVLFKSVESEPADRYPSAAEFASELRRWLDGQPVEAGGLSMPQRVGRWVTRHPLAMTTAFAIAIVMTSIVTALSVNWRYNRAPAFLELDTTGRPAVVLRSRSGNQLHRWNSDRLDARVASKLLLDRPTAAGGGRCALIAFGPWGNELENRMALFDLRRPERPVWTIDGDERSLGMPPPISRQGHAGDFRPILLLVADFFPEEPTPQFAMTLANGPFSATCVRIVGWNGETLHEFWHDGALHTMHWLEKERILIVSAVNSEGTAQQRLGTEAVLRNIPVVFAVRPTLRTIEKAWLGFDGGGGTLRPLWYRAVHPLEVVAQFGDVGVYDFEPTTMHADTGERTVTAIITLKDDLAKPALVYLSIDPLTGAGSVREVCDQYVANGLNSDARFLDPPPFQLGAVPPAVPWPSE